MSHSPGPMVYPSAILGVTIVSLCYLLGKPTSNIWGCQLTFPFVLLRASRHPLASQPSGHPSGSSEPVSWEVRQGSTQSTPRHDGWDHHTLFSTAMPIQVCFLYLQPTQPPERPLRPATRFPLWLLSSFPQRHLTVNTVNEALFGSSFPFSTPRLWPLSELFPYYVGLFSLILFLFF